MKKLVVLLMTLIIYGCATTQGTDPDTLKQTSVTEPRVKKVRSADPVTTRSKTEEPKSAPVETRPPYVPPSMDRPSETQPAIARVTPSEPRDLTPPEYREPVRRKLPEPHADGSTGLARITEENDEKLIRIFVGMDRATVEATMASAHNPAKRERITGSAGQTYEVLFYLTREPRKGKPVTERLMTPVILRNNEVVAIGNFHLKKLRTTGSVERKKRQAAKSKE